MDTDCLDGGEGDRGAPPDCDDSSPAVHPGAQEFEGDGQDQDCDGLDGSGACAVDADEDGWVACLDCDDDQATVHPQAIEHCDGLDNDCDGLVDEDLDRDGDGTTPCGFDCDDEDAEIGPLREELACDGIDNDCDGIEVDGPCGAAGASAVTRPFGCSLSLPTEGGPLWAAFWTLALFLRRRRA